MSQKVLRLLNRILNTAIVLSLIAAGLYSIYAIWDNNRIYEAPLELQTELKKLKPDEKKPSFQELLKLNPDVVGWVTLEGTQIDDPIVQGEDNREYLNKNVYGEYALAGSIFLDSRCDREFQDKYQLVYGHHMEKHRMFGDLDLYLKKKFFKKHTIGTLMVPGKTYPLQILASMKVDANDAYIFDPQTYPADPEAFLQMVLSKNKNVHKELVQKLEKEPDKYSVLALSTCSSEKEEERIVVLAVYEHD